MGFENLPLQAQIFVGFIALLTLGFHVRYNDQAMASNLMTLHTIIASCA